MRVFWLEERSKIHEQLVECAAKDKIDIPKGSDIIVTLGGGDVIIAFSAVKMRNKDVDILYFHVFDESRKKGAAEIMLSALDESVMILGFKTLRYALPKDDIIRELFSSHGYEIFYGPKEYVTTAGALFHSKVFRRIAQRNHLGETRMLSNLTDEEKRIVLKFFEDRNIKSLSGIDRERSAVSIQDGVVCGLILCEKAVDGVRIVFIYAHKNDNEHYLDCFSAYGKRIMNGLNDSDLKISFATDNLDNEALARALVDDNALITEQPGESLAVKYFAPKRVEQRA